MRNIALNLQYEGTNYAGWQIQKNANTIEAEIEKAITKLTGEIISVNGCSRTDAGVHAEEYVANFYTESTIPGDKFVHALNNKLPKDICINSSKEVPMDFHARYHCKKKTYCYTILNKDVPDVFRRNYYNLIRGRLNIDIMKESCKYFIGTHDFEAFKSEGSSAKTTIRTIYDAHIENYNNYIEIYFTGDGFLYNMVRIMVATLIDIGRGKVKPEVIEKGLKTKSKELKKRVAPAKGLMLKKVFY